MSESELVGFGEHQRYPPVWYSKHKARHRKGVGRWFVMKNNRTVNGFSIARTVVVKDLDTRKEAIAMVKLLEGCDDKVGSTQRGV
jgi:hypothetical protein